MVGKELKKVGAQLLVDMAEYFSDNQNIVVNRFVRAGITGALSYASTCICYTLQWMDLGMQGQAYSTLCI